MLHMLAAQSCTRHSIHPLDSFDFASPSLEKYYSTNYIGGLLNCCRLNVSMPGGGTGAGGGGGEPRDWWFWVRTLLVMVLGAISSLGSLGSNLAVEKDWVKVNITRKCLKPKHYNEHKHAT